MKFSLYSVIACLAFLTMAGTPAMAFAEVLLVGSSNIHFHEISKTKLRDLYTGQSQSVGDAAVLVVDRDNEFGEKSRFVSTTLGFTTEEFRTVRRLLECIGISKAPTVARDSKHMIELLASNPNALGYLTRQELQNHNLGKFKLKLIKVLAE